MTLVLDGTPSSGGPRCLRSRGERGLVPFAASVLTAASGSFSSVSDLFVISTRGLT